MAIAFVQQTSQTNSGPAGGGQNVSLAGTVAGNILICVAAQRTNDASTILFPGDWTVLQSYTRSANASRAIKVAAKYTPGGVQTVTFTGANIPVQSALLEYSDFGIALDPTILSGSEFTGSTVPSFPAIAGIPVASKGVLLSIQFKSAATPNPGPITVPAGLNYRTDTFFAMFGNRHRLTIWDQIIGSAAAGYGPYATSGSTDGSEAGIMAQIWIPPHVEPAGSAGGDTWIPPMSATEYV